MSSIRPPASAPPDEDMRRLEQQLRDFRLEVIARMGDLAADVKHLNRLEGDMARQDDAITRIGRVVDDHEERLRSVEQDSTLNTSKLAYGERGAWLLLTALTSVITGVSVWVLTQGYLS